MYFGSGPYIMDKTMVDPGPDLSLYPYPNPIWNLCVVLISGSGSGSRLEIRCGERKKKLLNKSFKYANGTFKRYIIKAK